MKPTSYYPWASDDAVTEDIDENRHTGTIPNKAAPDIQFEAMN